MKKLQSMLRSSLLKLSEVNYKIRSYLRQKKQLKELKKTSPWIYK